MTEKTVYLNWNDQPFTVVSEFLWKGYAYYVLHRTHDYDSSLIVEPVKDCKDEEETEIYKRKRKLEEMQKDEEKLITEMQDKAIKSLAMRIRINSVFGDVQGNSAVGVFIANELEKLIKPEVKND